MITRRVLLQRAIVAGAAWTGAPAIAAGAGERVAIAVIARDSRRARAFGAAMHRAGSPVLGVGADALPVLEALDALLADGPRPVCGLTTFATRMIVGHVAAGYGLRVAIAGEHPLPPDLLVHDPAAVFAHALVAAQVPVCATRLHAWQLVPANAA